MKRIKVLLSMLLLSAGLMASAQTISVRGVVKDSSTGESIPAASVIVKGTSNGTITDNDGNYTISVASDASLVVSSIK